MNIEEKYNQILKDIDEFVNRYNKNILNEMVFVKDNNNDGFNWYLTIFEREHGDAHGHLYFNKYDANNQQKSACKVYFGDKMPISKEELIIENVMDSINGKIQKEIIKWFAKPNDESPYQTNWEVCKETWNKAQTGQLKGTYGRKVSKKNIGKKT